jgi:Effector Associated Constant Component 1
VGEQAQVILDQESAESLWDWLEHEPALRGHLTINRSPVEGQMGGPFILEIALAAPVVIKTLSQTLQVWLVQRRSDTTIKLKGPDGTQISVSNKGPAPPDQLLSEIRTVLEKPSSPAS